MLSVQLLNSCMCFSQSCKQECQGKHYSLFPQIWQSMRKVAVIQWWKITCCNASIQSSCVEPVVLRKLAGWGVLEVAVMCHPPSMQLKIHDGQDNINPLGNGFFSTYLVCRHLDDCKQCWLSLGKVSAQATHCWKFLGTICKKPKTYVFI